VLEFDPCGGWTQKRPMPHPRTCASATVLDGKVVIVCGYTNAPVRKATEALLYDPVADSFTTLPDPSPRAYLGVTVASGKLLAIGGYAGTTTPLATIDVFDPTVETWSVGGMLTQGRFSHGTATVGSIVGVVGGFGGSSHLRTVEQTIDP